MYFKAETDIAQNRVNDFFFRGPLHRKDFKLKKYGGMGLISEKTYALYAELNKRAEAVTSNYSVTGNFLQYIYSVLVTKNHQKI